MSEQNWLIERVEDPEGQPFLHWVGERFEPLPSRMLTEWPPTEEDLDYALDKVGDDRVVVDLANVAEQLATEGLEDAEVRPFDEVEQARLSAWRPFGRADRLLARSTRVTVHGARCEVVLSVPMWEAADEVPRVGVVSDGSAFLVVVRADEERYRLDAGDLPRAGQSLRAWLTAPHVRFTCSRNAAMDYAAWTLSGIRAVEDAERLVLAAHALHACAPAAGPVEVSLECSAGPVRIRLLPPEVVVQKGELHRCLQSDHEPSRGTT